MAGEVKLSDVILKHFMDNTLDKLSEDCAANADACGGAAITQEQEEVISYALFDGKITERERAMLGFLPAEVVAGVAGADPARVKAEALVKKLRTAKHEEIPDIAHALRALDPATRATAAPEVEKLMDSLLIKQASDQATAEWKVAQYQEQLEKLNARIEALTEKYDEMKSAGYRRINNTGISEDGAVYENMIAAHERKMVAYHAANIQPLIERRERIGHEIDCLCCSDTSAMDNAVASLVAYVRDVVNNSPPTAAEITQPVRNAMTVDELEARVRETKDRDAFITMIDRFPGDAKTTALCYEGIRSYKVPEKTEDMFKDPVIMKMAGYVSRTRARLEPVLKDIPDELLPVFLAANPTENVSRVIMGRILASERDDSWKVYAIEHAFNGRADKQTLLDAAEAIVTLNSFEMKNANDTLGRSLFDRNDISPGVKAWVFYHLNARHHADENWPRTYKWGGLPYESYRSATGATDRFARRTSDYDSEVDWIGEYAACLAGEYSYEALGKEHTLDPDGCDRTYIENSFYHAGRYLTQKHKDQIRAAMENGATQLYFMPGEEIIPDEDFPYLDYLDGEIVGVKEEE